MESRNVEKIKELSHNINTPLTTIMGYASLVKKDAEKAGPEQENYIKWAERIRKEVLKISRYSKKINAIATNIKPD